MFQDMIAVGNNGGGIIPSNCWFTSTRTTSSITRTYSTPVDRVIIFPNSAAMDNIATGIQATDEVSKGNSVVSGGRTVSLSADGITLTLGSGSSISYYGFLGISN